MFNIGGGELLIIFLVALVVLGPTKLPEAARQLGKWMGEFRRLSAGFQAEVRNAMDDPVNHAVKKAEAAQPIAAKSADKDADGATDGADEDDDAQPAMTPASSEIVTLASVKVDETDDEKADETAAQTAPPVDSETGAPEDADEAPVPKSTAIPPIAPMSGSSALSNGSNAPTADAPTTKGLPVEMAPDPNEDSEGSDNSEADDTVEVAADPPMFGDR